MGYFEGMKGLRQRDPLFLYLFVIVMEVLSRMLDVVAKEKILEYHPKCKKSDLKHLVFANDC